MLMRQRVSTIRGLLRFAILSTNVLTCSQSLGLSSRKFQTSFKVEAKGEFYLSLTLVSRRVRVERVLEVNNN